MFFTLAILPPQFPGNIPSSADPAFNFRLNLRRLLLPCLQLATSVCTLEGKTFCFAFLQLTSCVYHERKHERVANPALVQGSSTPHPVDLPPLAGMCSAQIGKKIKKITFWHKKIKRVAFFFLAKKDNKKVSLFSDFVERLHLDNSVTHHRAICIGASSVCSIQQVFFAIKACIFAESFPT